MGDRHVRGVFGIAIVGVFLAFIAASPASGQVLYGGITGTVTDSTGGTVPAAQLRAKGPHTLRIAAVDPYGRKSTLVVKIG